MKLFFPNSIRWSIFIFGLTVLLACIFSVASTTILEGVGWGIGMLIVLIIVLVGILFDMMGIASTSAQERPFHAMAAERVSGARHAIRILRNADRFANFCNDVIGDICGIISGAASAIVVIKLFSAGANASAYGPWYFIVNVAFTALVSGLTVGGKALGKSIAIYNATAIILYIGKTFFALEHRFGIKIFQDKKNKGSKGKRGHKHAAR
jgi:CBS domain containing-hemolysin-like protein